MTNRNRARVFIYLGLFALMGVAPAQAEKTFVYCSEGSPSTFNPQLATDGPTFVSVANTIYDRLVSVERKARRPCPVSPINGK